jgi:hypothetical protein
MRRLEIVIAAIALARVAHAAPGDDPTTSRTVFAGAVSPDPTSIVGNPAALDLGREGLHIWTGGLATIDRYAITLDQEDASGAKTAGPPVRDTVASPGGQFALYEVRPEFVAGLLVDLPPAEDHPADRDALRYHTLGGGIREKTYAALGGSLRLADGLYVGGSAAYVQTVIDMRFARDTHLETGRGVGALEDPTADELYDVHAYISPRGFNRIAFTLGLAWKLGSRVAIGAAYREPQGFNGAVIDQGVVNVTRPSGQIDTGIATVSFIPAQSFELGGRVTLVDGLDAIGGARWDLTSRTTQLDLRMFGSTLAGVPEWYPRPRGFRDTLSAWGGVEQDDTGQTLIGGARIGVSNGATSPSRISPQQVEGWNVSGDLGAQLRLTSALVLVATYDAVWYVPQDVTSSSYDPIARLDCIDSNYDLSTSACQTVRDGYGIDTASGHYSRWQHVVKLGLRLDLD